MSRARVAVLVSGNGSNLQALADEARAPGCPYEIVLVVSNRPGAGGLARAAEAGIPTAVVDHKAFASREAFDAALGDTLAAAQPDWIACAGFMRVLGAAFVERFAGRILNIHPALLPAFKGLDTHARALQAGVAWHGCTVHWVTAGVDEGAIIGQSAVRVYRDDTEEALTRRVLAREHRLYPACLALVTSGRARLQDGRTLIDGQFGAFALDA